MNISQTNLSFGTKLSPGAEVERDNRLARGKITQEQADAVEAYKKGKPDEPVLSTYSHNHNSRKNKFCLTSPLLYGYRRKYFFFTKKFPTVKDVEKKEKEIMKYIKEQDKMREARANTRIVK